MVSFTLKLAKFTCILHLILKCLYFSCASIVDLNVEPFSVFLEAKLVSEKIVLMMEKYPDINAMDHIKKLFDKKLTIEIGLHQEFDNMLYDYNLCINNFEVLINLSSELSDLIREKKVKSSEYINKILVQFSDAKNIDILNLSDLYLNEIPEAICKFDKLRVLLLNDNDLADFKIDSNCLPALQRLSINYNNRLTLISESISSLTALNFFSAIGCSISKIPESIYKLKNLHKLRLCKNLISELPRNFSKLEKLKTLCISNCKFEEFFINMASPPELIYIKLQNNSSLKCLKILIPEIIRDLISLDVKNCPFVNVEVYVNLKNAKFKIFGCSDKQLDECDYLIMFNPTKLINNIRFFLPSDFQFFENCLETGVSGLCKTIFVREFDPEIIMKNLISRDDLIAKWIGICEKYNLNTENSFVNDFENSIAVLKNLYEIKNKDYSNLKDLIPFECKEKMITILTSLFDQLEKKNLEFQAIEIMKLFKEDYLEQLVYFNYLLKINKSDLRVKINFLNFIKETIEVLKDYLIIFCLNYAKYELELLHNLSLERMRIDRERERDSVALTDCNEVPTYDKRDNEAILEYLLRVIMDAKLDFDSKFTIDFISSKIYNAIKRIGNRELFDNEIAHFFLDHCEIMPEYFEYETQSNTSVISNVSIKGIEVLINLIINGYALTSYKN